jgi:hypothetical protein
MANAQYPTLPSKTFVVRQFGLGASPLDGGSRLLTSLKEPLYLSTLSLLVRMVRLLRSAGWPIWLSESRIMLLAIL